MTPRYILTGATKDELALSAVAFLESLGVFTIGMAQQWEGRAEFCARVGISERTFARKIKRRHVPPVAIERGPGGRLVKLRATPEFESYMSRR